jgi:adenylyl- and sulfurtransferase ThiI
MLRSKIWCVFELVFLLLIVAGFDSPFAAIEVEKLGIEPTPDLHVL